MRCFAPASRSPLPLYLPRKGLFVCHLIATILLVVALPPVVTVAAEQKRVLAIYGDRSDLAASIAAEREIQATLAQALGKDLDFHSEYIEARRVPEDERSEEHTSELQSLRHL